MKNLLRRRPGRSSLAVPPAKPDLLAGRGPQEYWLDVEPPAVIPAPAAPAVPEELPVALRHCVTCDVKVERRPGVLVLRTAGDRVSVISDICLYGDCQCDMPGCACECHDDGCDHDHG